MSGSAGHSIATISAPITDIDGSVIMSVTAAVFSTLSSGAIRDLGAKVRDTAHSIEQRIADHGHLPTT
jgi:DNA-binding IclR family transcriptional regulator